jgi:predicted transcriptional regulator
MTINITDAERDALRRVQRRAGALVRLEEQIRSITVQIQDLTRRRQTLRAQRDDIQNRMRTNIDTIKGIDTGGGG